MALVEFKILGPLEVRGDDGELIDVRSPMQRALLAILLLHANTAVSFEELTDELWGASAPRTARESLQNHAARLRRLLGPSRLETDGGAYRLKVDSDELDLARFESLVTEARRLEGAERATALGAALACWRGLALVEFPRQPFAQGEVVRLEELRLGALEERVEADLGLGRHEALVPELEALVVRHPLRETLWRQLMLALYRSGRQADALAAYRRAHRALTDELGLEPGPVLRDLQRAILVQDPGLTAGDAGDGLLERAAALLPTGHARRAETLVEYAVALRRLGEVGRARSALEEAVRLARQHGEPELAERAGLLLSTIDLYTGATTFAEHLERARRAARVHEEAGDELGLADALRAEGTMLRDIGRADEAASVFERAIEAGARSGNRSAEGLSRNFLGTALLLGSTPVETAIARCERELAAQDWGRPGPIGLLSSLAVLHAQAGRFDEAREHLEQTRVDCRAAGLAGELAWVAAMGALVAALTGDLEALEEELRLLHELAEALGYATSVAVSAPELARVRLLRGDHADVERLTAIGRRFALADDLAAQVAWRRAEALLLARDGDTDRAHTLAQQATAISGASDWLALHAEMLEDRAGLEPPDRAAVTLADAVRAHERKGNAVGAERARQALTILSR